MQKLCALLCAAGLSVAAGAQTFDLTDPDGLTVSGSFSGSMPSEGAVVFTLLIDEVSNALGSWLNIQTFNADDVNLMDTEIALFDAAGNFIAADDDGNINDPPGDILYSLLTFGVNDPFPMDATPGEDGELAAGLYILVVAGYDTVWGDTLMETTFGASSGDFDLLVTYGVPAPGAAAVLGASGLLALRRRR